MMQEPVKIDIVILSYAQNERLKKLTEQTIATLLTSEDQAEIQFNVVVIESNQALKPYQFDHSLTIYPDTEFGFNKYLNIGIKATDNPYICLCNNDLIFHKNWARAILIVMDKYPRIKSANPFCDNFRYSFPINHNKQLIMGTPYNFFKGALTGWCIFVERELFKAAGQFDESFNFWYADRDYGKTLLKYKIKHALVLNSVVTHLGNRSHGTISDEKLAELTYGQRNVYENKWGKDSVPVKVKIIGLLTSVKNKLLALLK
jgi:GT2 family glycosyltransferase